MLSEAALLVSLSVAHSAGTQACASSAWLTRAVELRLERRIFVPASEARLHVDIVFTQRGSEIEARIELRDADDRPRGIRSLRTPSHCSALDDSLALSVALLVDEPPEAEETASSANEPAGTSPAARLHADGGTPITIPADVVAPREPWRAYAGAAAAAAWGLLPQIRPALVVQLRLEPRHFPAFLLQGEGFAASRAERDAGSGARFRLFRVGLALCPQIWGARPRSLGVCFGQKLTWLEVEGYGFDHDASDQSLGYALSLGLEGRQRLFGPLALRVYFGGEAALLRDRFSSGNPPQQPLFQPSVLALSGEIGLEAAVW